MHKLSHDRLCPFSRSIRISPTELGIEVDLVEEEPWQ
jgi:glutathione S-transferase